MQGVGRVGGPGGVAAARPRQGRAGFSLGNAAPGTEAQGATAAEAVAPTALGLLAVQQGGGDAERDAAARRRADSMLEDLAGLQAELLGGTPDPARLARLAALAAGDAGADPALRELVQAVALRAQLELARRGR